MKISQNLLSYLIDFLEIRQILKLMKLMKLNKFFFDTIKSFFKLTDNTIKMTKILNKKIQKNDSRDYSNYNLYTFNKKINKDQYKKSTFYQDLYFCLRLFIEDKIMKLYSESISLNLKKKFTNISIRVFSKG